MRASTSENDPYHPALGRNSILRLPKRRSHDLHVVLCHQLLVRIGIDTLPLREHLFEPTGRHTEQQYTGLRPDVLERVRSVARNAETDDGAAIQSSERRAASTRWISRSRMSGIAPPSRRKTRTIGK